jgi:hypothetical protein
MCYTYDNWSFHFIWVIGMSYYQEGHIEKFGEVVKWKTFSIKIYILSGNWTGLQSKRLNSRTIHQTCLGYQLPKPFTGLVWSPTGLVRWTRPVRPRPASRGIYRTCSSPIRLVRWIRLFRGTGFQRGLPNLSSPLTPQREDSLLRL